MSTDQVRLSEALHDSLRSLRESVVDQVVEEVSRSSPHVVMTNSAIESALDEAFDKALSVDFVDVVTGAWRHWQDLREKAAQSRRDDARHVVPLVEHSIDVVYEPSIEVVMNGAAVATVTLTLKLIFKLSGFRVTLVRGALTAVDVGECSPTLKLGLSGASLWEGSLGVLPLPGHWTFDPPRALDGLAKAAE